MSILETIGFKKRFHVGISLSANNFIELVAVDAKTKTVTAYASGNVKYNNAIREIIDYDEFTEVLENLFNDAGLLPSDCAVTLTLPNVQFGISTIESASEETFIIDNIQSEIEDLYVFKRSGNEPFIAYTKMPNNNRTIVFSAIQSKVIRRIIEIFDSFNCEIVRIESSYCSFLKSIQFCERFSKYTQKEEKTSILLITANSCCAFYLEDGFLLDYFEEPIAVKSFSKEEVYSTISKLVENTISKNKPENLLIVSETDEVDPGLLSSGLAFQGEIDAINKGINTNEKFIDISMDAGLESSMITYMTIEAVGAAVANYEEYPVNINFLPDERIKKNLISIGEYEVDATILIGAIIGAGIVAALIIVGLFSLFFTIKTNELTKISTDSQDKINVFKKKAAESQTKFKGLYPSMKHIIDTNKKATDIFEALSTDIPENIYIKQFATNSNGGLIIIGKAKTSEDVREFVTSLKSKNNDLHLSKIAIDENQVNLNGNSNLYVFEIKTQNVEITAESPYAAPEQEEVKGKKSLKNKSPIL